MLGGGFGGTVLRSQGAPEHGAGFFVGIGIQVVGTGALVIAWQVRDLVTATPVTVPSVHVAQQAPILEVGVVVTARSVLGGVGDTALGWAPVLFGRAPEVRVVVRGREVRQPLALRFRELIEVVVVDLGAHIGVVVLGLQRGIVVETPVRTFAYVGPARAPGGTGRVFGCRCDGTVPLTGWL